MNFRTPIPLKKHSKNLIDYHSKILLIGSCFSENIGNKLAYYKLQSVVNPLGILFHPKAIERLITLAINEYQFTERDIFYHNEHWHCFDAHSSLSSTNKNELIHQINSAISNTLEKLKTSTHIILTLGTSWVYRHIESDSIVANCHKIPQKKFLKEVLTVDEISESLEAIHSLIKSVNKNATIIHTVSPVRHIKDGFIENQQSKSHLISAIHQTINEHKTSYFPSYEIMMDELRDYRFYAEDMIHPNTTAINYIWNRFCEVWLHPSAEKIMLNIESIQKGLSHRPFNENSKQHQQFTTKLQEKIQLIQTQFSHITF